MALAMLQFPYESDNGKRRSFMRRKRPGMFKHECVKCGFVGTRGVIPIGFEAARRYGFDSRIQPGLCRHRGACSARQAKGAAARVSTERSVAAGGCAVCGHSSHIAGCPAAWGRS